MLINTALRGFDNFDRAKSRLALTSGNLEKVSDGKAGELSPFAKAVKEVLSTNEHERMPFNLFSGEVILRFGDQYDQSPQFGNLVHCGHEGGALVFKRRKTNGERKVENIYQEIKDKFKNMYIPLSQEDEAAINELELLNQKKNKAVRNQQYEQAADLRDQEKQIFNAALNRTPNYISFILTSVIISEEEKKSTTQLDKDYIEFKEEEQRKAKLKEKGVEEVDPLLSSQAMLVAAGFSRFWSLRINPVEQLLKQEQDALFESLDNGIIELAIHYVKLIGNSQNPFLIEKLNSLMIILQEVYGTQLKLLFANNKLTRNDIMNLKQQELDIWNWILEVNEAESNKD